MSKPVKFLILRFSSIGDIVLTTPVIRCLKMQYPDAEIHYFTKKKFGFLLDHNPYVDRTWLLEGGLDKLAPLLRAENFDYVIDLHHNIRTLHVKILLGKPSFSFPKLNIRKFLLTKFKIDTMPRLHVVDRYMATVKKLGVVNDMAGLDYFIPESDKVNADDLPETHRSTYFAYAIGGQHFTKKLPPSRMIELCNKIDAPIILLGGQEDFEQGNIVEKALGKQLVFNACGLFNFNQSADIIRQSVAVFTHDTGLMHVAAAFKKKTYSLWGNTVPAFGMYPYQTNFKIIENNHLSCRPCSKIGGSSCPEKHFRCMNDLSFDFDIPERHINL